MEDNKQNQSFDLELDSLLEETSEKTHILIDEEESSKDEFNLELDSVEDDEDEFNLGIDFGDTDEESTEEVSVVSASIKDELIEFQEFDLGLSDDVFGETVGDKPLTEEYKEMIRKDAFDNLQKQIVGFQKYYTAKNEKGSISRNTFNQEYIAKHESDIDRHMGTQDFFKPLYEFLEARAGGVQIDKEEVPKYILDFMSSVHGREITKPEVDSAKHLASEYIACEALITKVYNRMMEKAQIVADEHENNMQKKNIKNVELFNKLRDIAEQVNNPENNVVPVRAINQITKSEKIKDFGYEQLRDVRITSFNCGECEGVTEIDNTFHTVNILDSQVARNISVTGVKKDSVQRELAVTPIINICEHCNSMNILPKEAISLLGNHVLKSSESSLKSSEIHHDKSTLRIDHIKAVIGDLVEINFRDEGQEEKDLTVYTVDKLRQEYNEVRETFDNEVAKYKVERKVKSNPKELSKVTTNFLASMISNNFFSDGFRATMKGKVSNAIVRSNLFVVVSKSKEDVDKAMYDLINMKKYKAHLTATRDNGSVSSILRETDVFNLMDFQNKMENKYGIEALPIYNPNGFKVRDVNEENVKAIEQAVDKAIVSLEEKQMKANETYKLAKDKLLNSSEAYKWIIPDKLQKEPNSELYKVLGNTVETERFLNEVVDKVVKVREVKLLRDRYVSQKKGAIKTLVKAVEEDKHLSGQKDFRTTEVSDKGKETTKYVGSVFGVLEKELIKVKKELDSNSLESEMQATAVERKAYEVGEETGAGTSRLNKAQMERDIYEAISQYAEEYFLGENNVTELKYINNVFKGFKGKDYITIVDACEEMIDEVQVDSLRELVMNLTADFNREKYSNEIKAFGEFANTIVNMRGTGFTDEEVFEYLSAGNEIPQMQNYYKRSSEEESLTEYSSRCLTTLGEKVPREFEEVLTDAYINNTWIEELRYKYHYYKRQLGGTIREFMLFRAVQMFLEKYGHVEYSEPINSNLKTATEKFLKYPTSFIAGTVTNNMVDFEGEYKIPNVNSEVTPEDIFWNTFTAAYEQDMLEELKGSQFVEAQDLGTEDSEDELGFVTKTIDARFMNLYKYLTVEVDSTWTPIEEEMERRKEWAWTLE